MEKMMRAVLWSSGDLRVDRRYEFVEMLLAQGDVQAAFDMMSDILEIVPNWAFGCYQLGCLAEKLGISEQAVLNWTQALVLDPRDICGASLMLALHKAEQPETMPAAFVENLFDAYADGFDKSLVGKLGYRVPEKLGPLVAEIHPERFQAGLDLGCGTGLAGIVFAPAVDHLTGIDVSKNMLNQAKKRGIYSELVKADIKSLHEFDIPQYDLVVASDVFIYLGDLASVFGWLKSAMTDHGLCAFSVETHLEDADFILTEARRFSHSAHYIRRLLSGEDWSILTLSNTVLRQDRGQDVHGLLWIVRRNPRGSAQSILPQSTVLQSELELIENLPIFQ